MSKPNIKETISKLLNSATVVNGAETLRLKADVAFDIETAPARPDLDDSALLDAETARVAAIGYYLPSQSRIFIAYDKDEAAMLRQFWELYLSINNSGAKLICFNCFGFDLPMIIRRS